MYRGQIAEISNRATWTGPFCQIVDTRDGSIINILNPDIGFDCAVYIGELNRRWHQIIGSIENGKVIASSGDDGPGFQWSFTPSDLSCFCAGTYKFGIKTTTNGEPNDLFDGTLVIIEGN